ncbi:AP-4 complex subunit sigma-1 [Octopus bimaculoides]|nr:AP-4 complex subunit sigma-1 [Octopus bimaculoides]XP_014767798.1 AP-4 complex subunit sigma-1 [Octopus bimaculoides]XP_029650990.1 AP-4 complex subunit sigma-1 [Octopus sinensis]XP_052832660.1 AP-4 complex subunit sigma-1 [Octopus bimaculoides]XP_052832661.1 AP-4 complex subunit sigma-1 [Octopus bimaculoides]|eukprot:XP_014767797.1 PREDICTED: AP-4 complex subunit sigma-1-like [Octopus bimaculoides]
MLKFLLIINKAGRLRLSHYFEHHLQEDRSAMERDIVRHCLASDDKQCTFWEYRDFVVVYRKYVNLYLVAAVTSDENELAIYELMHNLLETLNVYFDKVSELDIIYNIDRVHVIIQEMFNTGYVMETSKNKALTSLRLLDTVKR